MLVEVDYYNTDGQVRTKRVETEDERLIPFKLREADKRFSLVKRVTIITEEQTKEVRDGTV